MHRFEYELLSLPFEYELSSLHISKVYNFACMECFKTSFALVKLFLFKNSGSYKVFEIASCNYIISTKI